MSVATIYRDPEEGLRARRKELLRKRRGEAAEARKRIVPLLARRSARAAAGAVAVLAVLWQVGFGLVERQSIWLSSQTAQYTIGLGVAIGLALLVYALVRPLVSVFARLAFRAPATTSDVLADIARLEAASPAQILTARADALETASVALPMAGVALLGPLCLHFLVAGWNDWRSFGGWIALSYVVVGHVHLLLAVLCWRFARALRRTTTEALPARLHGGWKAWIACVAVSAVPGAVLAFIPVLLVAVTGLLIPLLFGAMQTRVWHERFVLRV